MRSSIGSVAGGGSITTSHSSSTGAAISGDGRDEAISSEERFVCSSDPSRNGDGTSSVSHDARPFCHAARDRGGTNDGTGSSYAKQGMILDIDAEPDRYSNDLEELGADKFSA